MSFIQKVTNVNYDLQPSLINNFKRVTLVNINGLERVTIDLKLSFNHQENSKSYDDLVVIELKQERYNRNSPIVKSLRSFGRNPYSISKYCIGMVSLNSDLKYNVFKQKIRNIIKLLQQNYGVFRHTSFR